MAPYAQILGGYIGDSLSEMAASNLFAHTYNAVLLAQHNEVVAIPSGIS